MIADRPGATGPFRVQFYLTKLRVSRRPESASSRCIASSGRSGPAERKPCPHRSGKGRREAGLMIARPINSGLADPRRPCGRGDAFALAEPRQNHIVPGFWARPEKRRARIAQSGQGLIPLLRRRPNIRFPPESHGIETLAEHRTIGKGYCRRVVSQFEF